MILYSNNKLYPCRFSLVFLCFRSIHLTSCHFWRLLSLQVLQNDVLAHKATVETVNKAGNDLVESSAGEEASSLQSKLENLNQRWKDILEKTTQRKQQLESALLQVEKVFFSAGHISVY